MNWSDCKECFFQPPAAAGSMMGTVVDYIDPTTKLSVMTGQTLEQVAARYPGTEVWLIDAAVEFREQVGRTEPQEITLEQWKAALEVLPPAHWERSGPFEAFQCSEHFSGRLTSTYLRRGQRAWQFTDVAGMGIDAIIKRVRKHLGEQATAKVGEDAC